MKILALDLGAKCGWAVNEKVNNVLNLKPTRFSSAGTKFLDFENFLNINLKQNEIELVAYEEVRRHIGTDAAHAYGGYQAILQKVCLNHFIEYKGVPVGTIKKHATGKGNASKEEMIVAANKFYPSINIKDDNHADALCLLHYANSIYSN